MLPPSNIFDGCVAKRARGPFVRGIAAELFFLEAQGFAHALFFLNSAADGGLALRGDVGGVCYAISTQPP